MPVIELRTEIKADQAIVFDLSRSIDLHKVSTQQTNERAIAGKTEGLIELNETVTWRAKHFGVYQNLTSKITEYDRPNYFADEMISGAFKRFKHEHHFSKLNDGTLMTDLFDYVSLIGLLGRLVNQLILKEYMTKLLAQRNIIIKDFAESGRWKEVLIEQQQ